MIWREKSAWQSERRIVSVKNEINVIPRAIVSAENALGKPTDGADTERLSPKNGKSGVLCLKLSCGCSENLSDLRYGKHPFHIYMI